MRRLDLRILALVADGTSSTFKVHEGLSLEHPRGLSWWDRFCFSAGHVYGRMRELEWSGHLDSVEGTIPIHERGGRPRRSYTITSKGMEALREDLFYKSRAKIDHPGPGSGDS